MRWYASIPEDNSIFLLTMKWGSGNAWLVESLCLGGGQQASIARVLVEAINGYRDFSSFDIEVSDVEVRPDDVIGASHF